MTYLEYCKKLAGKGYRVKDGLTFLNTPNGVWIQKIVTDASGFGLVSVLNPANKDPEFKLTQKGKIAANNYIRELKAKRKEILDAGLDTADEIIDIPDANLIEEDINFLGIDNNGEYCNGWNVSDNFYSDYPLLLKIGRDFEVVN